MEMSINKQEILEEIYTSVLPEYRQFFFDEEEKSYIPKVKTKRDDGTLYTEVEIDEQSKNKAEMVTPSVTVMGALQKLVRSFVDPSSRIICRNLEISNKLNRIVNDSFGRIMMNNTILKFNYGGNGNYEFIVTISTHDKTLYYLHVAINDEFKVELLNIIPFPEVKYATKILTGYDVKTLQQYKYIDDAIKKITPANEYR